MACGFCLLALSGAARLALLGCLAAMLLTFVFYVAKDRPERAGRPGQRA
jgi:cadaverine:lysine antiporter